jgi:flagellar motor switch protein FliG
MASRLESMLEKLIGQERSIVKVNIKLSDTTPIDQRALPSILRGIPGVAYSGSSLGQSQPGYVSSIPIIETIAVVIYLDNKLAKDKIEAVKQHVPKWLELDFSRGDSLKVEAVPWKEIPPEDIAIKQLSFTERNLWIIIVIAVIATIGFILFLLLFLPTRKFIKEGGKFKPQETGRPTADLESVMDNLRNAIAQHSGVSAVQKGNVLLEDIKEILARSPKKMDDLLGEIKDGIETLAKTQVTGGGGAGAGGGPSPGAMPDFLAALKETFSPAGGAAGGAGGSAMSTEALEVLRKIEEFTRKQAESTVVKGDVLDEPFKYLNSLANREISLFIDGEPARLAAIILGHIETNKSSEILAGLPDEKKAEISLAMATLIETPEMPEEIKDFLKRKMPTVKLRADFASISGNKALANILSNVPYEQCIAILDKLKAQDPTAYAAVKNEMFLFEDIAELDDRTVQEILKGLDKERLGVALSTAPDSVRQKFFTNMSEKALAILKEDIDAMQPASKDRAAQKKIVFFEDIVEMDNKVFQQILKKVDRDTLKMALKGVAEEIRQKVYSMMTERGAAILKEDLDVMPGIPRSQTEEAQKKILEEIRKFENQAVIAQHEILGKIQQLATAGRISLKKEE